MEIKISQDLDTEVLVINKFEGEKTSQELANTYAVEKDNFEGKLGTTYLLHTYGKIPADKILVIGFGKKEEFDGTKMTEAAAKAVKKLKQIKAKKAVFNFDGVSQYGKEAVIGAYIGDYSFDKYKTEKDTHLEELSFSNFDENDIKEGKIFAEAMYLTRNIANEPAEYATPAKLAEIATQIEGLDTKIYDKEEIKKMNMGAYLAVARGSAEPPKFIHMKYSNGNPKKRIALIGKGLCFDSGGMDLKPASSMLTMRDDMSGAACILGVMSALNKLKPQNIEIHGIIAACENMPGQNAYKPGDILTAKNGKTIEVDNTDAEGRLTLADALCYASELKVDEVIDIATLTGACMVALGSVASGVMGNDEDMIKDIIKTTGSRYGGASAAGVFLKEFVSNVKWVHIDVAGTAFLEKPQGIFIYGSTGVGVRTLLNYVTK